MTTYSAQSHSAAEPLGIRKIAVRLCMTLLGVWVMASVLFLQTPVNPLGLPVTDSLGIGYIELEPEHLASAVEEHDHESEACCDDIDCTESQDCSLPCASSCPAPSVAVLASLLYRIPSSGETSHPSVDNNGLVPPLASLLYRPPII